MARIYKTTDKITYKLGDIEVKISPLSVEDKMIITEYMTEAEKGSLRAMMGGSIHAIKSCVKDITGIENEDGSPYKLEFDGVHLSQNCIDTLMNIEISNKLIQLCTSFVSGVPTNLPDGISIVPKT